MSIFISRDRLAGSLKNIFDQFPGKPVLIHSDILKIGLIEKMKSRDEICADYEQVLVETTGGRTLLFPTFNYDYCGNGLYDRQKSPGQVGALSDYLRKTHSDKRTRTPIFNFCILNNDDFRLEECKNPFGADSTFAEIYRKDGLIIFLGAGFETNTFLHYIEESAGIEYRYIKKFGGKIVDSGEALPFVLDYRVRPLIAGAAEYDWPRLIQEASEAGIIHNQPAGHGTVTYYRAAALFDFWSEKIKQDELYLLTGKSRRLTEDLYQIHGRPLTFEAMETPVRDD